MSRLILLYHFIQFQEHCKIILIRKPSFYYWFLFINTVKISIISIMLLFVLSLWILLLIYNIPGTNSIWHNFSFSSGSEKEILVIITIFSLFINNYTFHKVLSLYKNSILAAIWYYFLKFIICYFLKITLRQ